MQPTLDQASDPAGKQLHQISQRYGLPLYVKHAAWDDLSKDELRRDLYADPAGKQFPCHTPAATWLSAAHFEEKRAMFNPDQQRTIYSRLLRAGEQWSILPDLAGIREKRAQLAKLATAPLPDSMFAFLFKNDKTGETDRHWRIANPAELQKAAAELQQHRDQMPYLERRMIAERLLKRAGELQVRLAQESEFRKIAGQGVGAPRAIVSMIQDRSRIASGEVRVSLQKVAQQLTTWPRALRDRGRLTKLAVMIDSIDESIGLRGRYTDDIPRPEDVLFGGLFKEAADEREQQVRFLTGSIYEKSQFDKLALSDVQAALGQDFAREVQTPLGDVDTEKLALHSRILPLPDQEVLEQVMSAAGIRPVLKTAAARPSFRWGDYLPKPPKV